MIRTTGEGVDVGYFDKGAGGITELRVHGVSGTPPEAMLCHPHAQRVAGDATTGFYRRLWESPLTSDDREGRRLEAYSWGGLTSGGWSRALWLLLLPFMLLNVAFFMTPFPYVTGDGEGSERRRRVTAEVVQRLLALALTVTVTLAAAGVFLDLLAWQCSLPGRCTRATPPLGLLVLPGLTTPSQRLAAGALPVLAVIAVLAWLGRATWQANETFEPPGATKHEQTWRSPLESRDFWRGGPPVKRLRWLHVSAALAVVSLLTIAPLAATDAVRAVRLRGLPDLLVTIAVAVLVACAVCVLQPSLSERVRNAEHRTDDVRDVRRPEWWLLVVAGLLAIVTNVVAWAAGRLGLPQPAHTRSTILPWFTGSSTVNLVVEAVAVALFLVLVLGSRTRRQAFGAEKMADAPAGLPWRGLAAVVFAALAWALAGGFAVALQLWVAGGLGNPAPETAPGSVRDPLLIPLSYFWGGVALVGALVASAVALVVIWLRARRECARLLQPSTPEEQAAAARIRLRAMYPDELGGAASPAREVRGRERGIAWRLALGQATDQAVPVLGWLACVLSAVALAVAGLYLADGDWITGPGQALLTVGSWVLALAAAGFFTLAYRAYDTPALRRSVGILWDLGTFWPRATHPLAPPCYTERAVPELLSRMEFLLDGAGPVRPVPAPPPTVVLSCHSQGTVLGAAVVSASSYSALDRVALLTYGCPLRRLYSGFFPTYFGPASLQRIGDLLAGPGTDGPATWPWLNLYRLSDPIGSYVFRPYPAKELPPDQPVVYHGEVDWQLIDPRFRPWPGDVAYPAALAHSDYWLDDAYAVALGVVQTRRASRREPAAN